MASAKKNTNLTNFIASIKTDGLIRTNRYSVTLTPPKSVGDIGDMRKMLLYCSDVQLPGVNISTAPVRTFGELREAPYEKLFDNLNMTFYVDNNMFVKAFFDRWINCIQNPQSRTFEYYNNYITNIKIEVEDMKDRKRYEVELYECYPKGVSPIQLSYESKEIMKLQVSMNYKNWISRPYNVPLDKRVSQWDAIKEAFSVPDKFLNNFGGFQSDFNNAQPETAGVVTGVTQYTGR